MVCFCFCLDVIQSVTHGTNDISTICNNTHDTPHTTHCAPFKHTHISPSHVSRVSSRLISLYRTRLHQQPPPLSETANLPEVAPAPALAVGRCAQRKAQEKEAKVEGKEGKEGKEAKDAAKAQGEGGPEAGQGGGEGRQELGEGGEEELIRDESEKKEGKDGRRRRRRWRPPWPSSGAHPMLGPTRWQLPPTPRLLRRSRPRRSTQRRPVGRPRRSRPRRSRPRPIARIEVR